MIFDPETMYLFLIYAGVAVVGACLGSFASAIAYRTRTGQSWIFSDTSSSSSGAARSCCPSCHHQLAWFDLIPVLSWCFNLGKCRYCARPVSVAYPAIEILGAFLLVTLFFKVGAGGILFLSGLGLPFLLSGLLLMVGHARPPLYISVISAAEVILWSYVFL